MGTALEILTTLSQIIGVPATLALAWAAFIIHDHGKQLKKQSTEIGALREKAATEIKELKEKFEKKLEDATKDQKEELRAIYGKIDDVSKNVNKLMGYLFKQIDADHL